jgi:hypothetical protein
MTDEGGPSEGADTSPADDVIPQPSPFTDRFVCPHPSCGVYAHQFTAQVGIKYSPVEGPNWAATVCNRCRVPAIWMKADDLSEWVMIYPANSPGIAPHADMPAHVAAIYEEARDVAQRSPRSAAGLLRLALQMLIDDLVPGTGSLDSKIGKLVAQGLDSRAHKAMDIVRVIGNNAVHPGQISLDDTPELVPSLFRLVNLVVEEMIARPKHLDQLFQLLPQQAREGIERRNTRAIEAPERP